MFISKARLIVKGIDTEDSGSSRVNDILNHSDTEMQFEIGTSEYTGEAAIIVTVSHYIRLQRNQGNNNETVPGIPVPY